MSFPDGVSYLYTHKKLTAKEAASVNLYLPQVRGNDIYFGFVKSGEMSINEFKFKTDIANEIGTNSYDIEKDSSKLCKLNLKNNPLRLILAIGGAMLRNEERYFKENMNYVDAYWRKHDQFNVFLSIVMDLYEFGSSSNVTSNIFNFAIKMIDPELDQSCVKNDNNNNNDCNDNNDDKVDVMAPLSELYKNERINLGNGNNITSTEIRFRDGDSIDYTVGGICLCFNLGTPEAHHIKDCGFSDNSNNNNKDSGHRSTHRCLICNGRHPMYGCRVFRACFGRMPFDTNWRMKSFEFDSLVEKKRYRNFNNYGNYNNYNNNYNNNVKNDNSGYTPRGRGRGRGGRGRGKGGRGNSGPHRDAGAPHKDKKGN